MSKMILVFAFAGIVSSLAHAEGCFDPNSDTYNGNFATGVVCKETKMDAAPYVMYTLERNSIERESCKVEIGKNPSNGSNYFLAKTDCETAKKVAFIPSKPLSGPSCVNHGDCEAYCQCLGESSASNSQCHIDCEGG